MNAKELLSRISNHVFSQITFYQFNKTTLQVTDKYREGRLAALKYTSDLYCYFLQIEKDIPRQFREQIDYQMKSNSCLLEGDFKHGLYDGLNDILDEIGKLQ